MTPARFFDAIASRYDRAYAPPRDESRRRMARVLRELPTAPARVLDLGVGTGRELSALLDAGYAPTGLDVSGEMLARCTRRARPVSLLCADFWSALPFGDESFDAALALHGTLAHAPHRGSLEALALELGRIVRPGGVWVAEAPSTEWLERLEALPESAEGSARRTGPQTFLYTDHVAGVSIEGRVFTDDEWRFALDASWRVEIRPIGPLERLLVARRTERERLRAT